MHVRPLKNLDERFDWYAQAIADDPTALKGRWASSYLPQARQVHLDLGCGKGMFTLEAARNNPDILFIGMDLERRCIALAAEAACKAELPNLIFALGDASLLGSYFAPEEIGHLYLNYATPFPRKKQASRRITNADFLMTYRKVLAPGATVEFRTDSLPFFRYSLLQFQAARYQLLWQTEDLLAEDSQSLAALTTEYETRLVAKGAHICALEALPAQPAPTSWDLDIPLSLMDYYHEGELEELDYVPLGMEKAVANFIGKRAHLRRQAEEQRAWELNQLNREFYTANADSFSATRTNPWEGWTRVLEHLPAGSSAEPAPELIRLLDLGCGNLRFEHYLEERYPDSKLIFYGVDSCRGLIPEDLIRKPKEGHECASCTHLCKPDIFDLRFQELDVVGALAAERPLSYYLKAPACDLSVAFGLMHHLPLPSLREKLLASLVEHTVPSGLVACSFWCFLEDEEAAANDAASGTNGNGTAIGGTTDGTTAKYRAEHARALVERPDLARLAAEPTPLGPRDLFLGWQGKPGTFRYCHSFTEEEVDGLLDSLLTSHPNQVELLDRFRSDGKSGNSNLYLVLRVL